MNNPPAGYSLLPSDDHEALIIRGDLLWCEGDAEWQEAQGDEIGDQVYGYYGVARPTPQAE